MRIQHQNLSITQQTATIRYPDRDIEYLFVVNNNPAPLYIRIGSPEIPTQRNFDLAVPPQYVMALSVNSNQFGFRLGDDDVSAALLTGITTIEGMIDERPPVVGGVPIQAASLSTADIGNGFQSFTGPTLVGPFNLSLWGGCQLFVLPNAGTGQGVILVEVSSDNLVWRSYGIWAFWPSVPLNLNIPRVANFVRFTFNAISGFPAIAGFRSVRATLTEIQQIDFNPGGNAISQAYSFPALGSQSFVFCTLGLPGAIVRVNVATGSRQELVWYTGPGPTGPWSLAAFREQSVTAFNNSIYRAIGNVAEFLRVDILDIGNNAGSGTLNLSIPGAPDLTAYLQSIFSALGDVAQPVNANQSIYHELDSIRLVLGTMNTSLSTIITSLTTINTSLGPAGTIVSVLSDIRTNTSNASGLLTSIDSRLTSVNTNLTTINTSLAPLTSINTGIGTVNTNLTTINTTLGTTNTRLQTIINDLERLGQVLDTTIVTAAAGAWMRSGGAIFAPFSGGVIVSCLASHSVAGILAPPSTIKLAIGDAANPFVVFYSCIKTNVAIGPLPMMVYESPSMAGFYCNPAYQYLWVQNTTEANVTITSTIALRS